MSEWRNTYRMWLENLKERDNLEDLGLDGSIILKYFLNKYDARGCTGLIWLRIGTIGGLL